MHPELERVYDLKTKERDVKQHLEENQDTPFSYNARIFGGKNRCFVDFAFYLSSHIIAIEVDENQHKKYAQTADVERTEKLKQDAGDRKWVQIRYNPDGYTNDTGKKIQSAYPARRGDMTRNEKQFTLRMDVLLTTLKHHIENIPNEQFTEVRLYYNGFHAPEITAPDVVTPEVLEPTIPEIPLSC